MHGKWVSVGALATAGVLFLALPSHAGDTHRLSLPAKGTDAPTLNLVDHGEGAETVSVYRGGGGGYRGGAYRGGGYRGGAYYGGYRGGAYYGGYRGYYAGRRYYGGYRNFGYYPYYRRPYYAYGYYPSYYYGSSYSYPYYSTPYYYTAPSVIYTTPSCSVDPPVYPSGVSVHVLGVGVTVRATARKEVAELIGAPAPVEAGDQTYPYDGGPRIPAPMPKAEPAPDIRPSAPPVDDHSVSLPFKVAGKLIYPAYGDRPAQPSAPRLADHGILVKDDAISKPSR